MFPNKYRQSIFNFCGRLSLTDRRSLSEKFGVQYDIAGETGTETDKRVLQHVYNEGKLREFCIEANKLVPHMKSLECCCHKTRLVAGNPSKWPAARGILAVTKLLLESVYGVKELDKMEKIK
jgi:hypothetical protein